MSKSVKRHPPDKLEVVQKYWVEAEAECDRLRAALKEIAENSHDEQACNYARRALGSVRTRRAG